MKRIIVVVASVCLSLSGFAQVKQVPVDKSPMDMSYYPANYPILKIQDKATEPLLARVIYGRPQKNGRVIFGELVEYGKIWRLGANEATEIEFYKDVKIGNTKVKKGRYTMYCIPAVDKWTIIINKDTDIWGAFKYDIKKDVLRVDVPVQSQSESVDSFTMLFEKNGSGINLIMIWDELMAKLPLNFQ
jgi:hypothetical protein